jgi:hypothetical protein
MIGDHPVHPEHKNYIHQALNPHTAVHGSKHLHTVANESVHPLHHPVHHEVHSHPIHHTNMHQVEHPIHHQV